MQNHNLPFCPQGPFLEVNRSIFDLTSKDTCFTYQMMSAWLSQVLAGVIQRATDKVGESLLLNLLQVEEKIEVIKIMIDRCATILIKNTRVCQMFGNRIDDRKNNLGLENLRFVLLQRLLRQPCLLIFFSTVDYKSVGNGCLTTFYNILRHLALTRTVRQMSLHVQV